MAHRFISSNWQIMLFLSGCFLLTSWTEAVSNNTSPLKESPQTSIMMPVFETPPPDDVTVDCFDQVPPPVDLMANDGMGGASFSVSPVDDPAGPIDACTGGVITRTWTAMVGMESTSVSQTITVSPDNTGPIVMVDATPDTVACEFAQLSAPNNANRFDTWVSSRGLAVSTNVEDCSGISMINNTAPIYPGDCGSVEYVFELEDNCGNMSEVTFTYVTIDTIKPQFVGISGDLMLSCEEAIPAIPVVTVEDNCTPDMVATFVESSGQIMDGTCAEYEYTILRTWSALDSCGNFNSQTQSIQVVDETPPTYTAPPNITISCNSDPDDLAITGDVTDAIDNCSPTVNIFYADSETAGSCPDERIIVRTWRVEDICGNLSGKQQEITIADMQGPSFNVPNDLTVDCNGADDLAVTGEATNLIDDCDPDPELDFSDVVITGSCPNSYTIERTWRADDRCGNFTEKVQTIVVADTQKPIFDQAPQDITYTCQQGLDINSVFQAWVNERGGAVATDNCTDAEDLAWFVYNAGTTDAPNLPAIVCPAMNGIVISHLIDVIVVDECDNSDTVSMLFEVVDQIPPTLENCPSDYTVPTNAGMCEGTVTLSPPLLKDECAISSIIESLTATELVTSMAMPGQQGEVPVDPVAFELNINQALPINATGEGVLRIELMDADAESPEEFFFVYSENGGLLGQTAHSDVQCGDSDTTFVIPIDSLNLWSVDGVIEVFLEPHIPEGLMGRFAINANCNPPTFALATLNFPVQEQGGFTYQYSINGGNRVTVSPIQTVDVTLDQGSHLIRYFATDCAGNMDSCSYTVMVADMEAPVLVCPADIMDELAVDSCGKTITLPLPVGFSDNCNAYGVYDRTLPATPQAALITFALDPNLNDYLAEAKQLVFDDVVANAYGDVDLVVDFQGDFNSTGAFVTITGDDGSTLATTVVGAADCAIGGQISAIIPAATFNAWAADGTINIAITPNDITVPPGVLGDGINPCDPGMVNANGDTDGVSYMTARLSYEELFPRYYTDGATATPITQVQGPAFEPQITFNLGTTEVYYLADDQAGNVDTCFFVVEIEDNINPTAMCQPANLFINPSGLQVEIVDASDVDNGSFDNCTIDSMWLSPNTFTCADFGQTINVTLSVIDESGNIGTCQTIVGIAPERPMPTANTGLCGGDSLFLIANPPLPAGNVYTFEWFDPSNDLISTEENFAIPNIDVNAEGAYRVKVTGLTGCMSEGVVFVNIEDLPLTPVLEAPSSICLDDNLVLETSLVPSGNDVKFYWYQGIPPMGTLLDSTIMPMYEIPAPHVLGTSNYYMAVKTNGCVSPSSAAVAVTVYQRPSAMVTYADTIVCGGESVFLGAISQTNTTYNWAGPNSFTANSQFPEIGPLNDVDGGYYYLTVNRGECASLPDSTLVTIKPRPAQPNISNNGPICAGETLTLITTTNNASAYHWESPNGMIFTTAAPSYTIPMATLNNQGLWTVYVTRNGCDSPESTATNVVVNAANIASANATPNPACEGDNVMLQGFATVAGSTYSWEGPNNYTSGVQMPTLESVTTANAGQYSITVTSPFGCADSSSVELEIFDGVVILGLSDNLPACINEGFNVFVTGSTFPANDGSYVYEWYEDGNPSPTSTNPTLVLESVEPGDGGNYSLEVITADGCRSDRETHTVNLNFIPAQPDLPFTISGESSFCEGESFTLVTSSYNSNDVTYYWNTPQQGVITTNTNVLEVNNVNTTHSGNYSVYVIRSGCESSTSPPRPITVNVIPDATIQTNSPVCEGDVISLQTTFFPEATYSWSGPSSFTASVFNPSISNATTSIHQGTYRVAVSRFGCLSDTISAQVQVKPRPAVPDVYHVAPICLDDPDAVLILGIDTMSAVANADYSWYSGDGGDFVGGPTSELIYEFFDFDDYPGGQEYNFYVRSEIDGCSSSLSDPTTVQFDTIPLNQAFAGIDTTVCSGNYTLRGATPSIGTGLWSLLTPNNPEDFSIVNPDQANSVVNGLTVAEAPYVLAWTLSNGACRDFDTDTLTIDVISAEPAFAGEDILACLDEMVVLSADPPGAGAMGVWRQGNAQVVFNIEIIDSLSAVTEVTGFNTNVYFFDWIVTSVCGVSSDQVIVTVSDPNPDAGPDEIICNDFGEASLQGITPSMGSNGAWHSVNPAVIVEEPLNPNSSVSNLQVGENYFVWELNEGFCDESSRDTVILLYKLPPVLMDDEVAIPFGATTEVMPFINDQVPIGTNLGLSGTPDLGTATVQGADVLAYTPPGNFVGIDELTYLAVSEGCPEVSALITFVIGAGADCLPPSIITPNNDGVNDDFVVPCLLDESRFPNSQVIIFNRWGDEVFRSAIPYESNWGGTYDGEDLPADTYFYIVDFGDDSDSVSGYVMIQR